MVSKASFFVADVKNCERVIANGSCLLVGNTFDCSDEPILYTLIAESAAAINAETISISLDSATVDGVAITTPAEVFIRKNSLLTFTGNNVVTVLDDVTVTATATTVNVAPLDAAIAISDTAETWALYLLETVTDLPINADSSETDSSILKDGIQGRNEKTRVDLNIPITYFASPLDISQAAIMLPASLGTENIFAVAIKSSGLVAFGRFKVMGLQESGATNDLVSYSTSLSGQAPFAIAFASSDTKINTAEQLAALNDVLRWSGIAEVA